MPSMTLELELDFHEGTGTVELDVEFSYTPGSSDLYTQNGWIQGDPAEVEITKVYWPYERKRKEEETGLEPYVKDHFELPLSGLPNGVWEGMMIYILENYEVEDWKEYQW